MKTHELEQQVRRARHRLWLNRWLRQVGWTITLGAVAFIVVVMVERLCQFGIGLVNVLGALAVLTALGSIVWLAIRHEDRLASAEALDEAAGLRERVTSGLYCADSDEPFARSCYADAVRTARRITVGRHLSVRYPRSFNWATCTVVAALLVLWLMPRYDLLGLLAKQQEQEKQRQAIKTTQAAVQQTVQQVKQLAEQSKALKETGGFEDLAELAAAEPFDADQLKRDAIKTLNRMSEKLQQQRDSAEGDQLDEIKKMLQRLTDPRQAETPVDKLRQGLARGDFKAAKKALDQMQEQLAKAKKAGNEAQVAAMQQQLAKLASQLEKAASQKRLKDEMKRAGLSEKDVQKLLENLSKRDAASIKKALEKKGLSKEQVQKLMKQIAKTKGACAKCKGLGRSLRAAAQGMKGSGDMESGQAASGLSQAAEQLSALEMLEQEMNDLQATLAELESAKEGLGGGPDDYGSLQGKFGRGMGPKPGRGRGGRAPRKETKFRGKAERLRGQQSPGAMIGQTFVDGQQLRGEAYEKAVEAATAAARDATEAVDRDRVPRVYHKAVKQYFGKIQEGLTKPKPATGP